MWSRYMECMGVGGWCSSRSTEPPNPPRSNPSKWLRRISPAEKYEELPDQREPSSRQLRSCCQTCVFCGIFQKHDPGSWMIFSSYLQLMQEVETPSPQQLSFDVFSASRASSLRSWIVASVHNATPSRKVHVAQGCQSWMRFLTTWTLLSGLHTLH